MDAKRKRGGQPGNTNALKHGFYARKFHELEAEDLQVALQGKLQDEIDMLRVTIRRVFDLATDETLDLEASSRALGTLGVASTRLAGLLNTQKLLYGKQDEVMLALHQAIKEVNEELRRP